MSKKPSLKHLIWIASTKDDLFKMPEEVRIEFGYGLYEAQLGKHPKIGKTLSGFGSAAVIELIENHVSGTYRAVYTVRFTDTVFVLHVFQKKSKKGIHTDKQDIDLVKNRLKLAEEIYKSRKKDEKK